MINKYKVRKIPCSNSTGLSITIDFFMLNVLGGHELLEIFELQC